LCWANLQGELGRRLPPPPAQWAQVDVSEVRVERICEFGQGYRALALSRRLGLHHLLHELIGAQLTPGSVVF
jgi:hypothetical protein